MEVAELPAIVVCDAGPLIHLDELGCLDLLSDFRDALVPDAVWKEVARHRPSALRRRSVDLQRVTVNSKGAASLLELTQLLSLDEGEVESLILTDELSADAILLTDDAAARLAAERLGFEVHGTIGVVVRAIRRVQRTKRQALNLLKAIPGRSTLYISKSLLASVIEQVRRS